MLVIGSVYMMEKYSASFSFLIFDYHAQCVWWQFYQGRHEIGVQYNNNPWPCLVFLRGTESCFFP